MGSASEYEHRAEACLKRAQSLSGIDCARWLQLAEEWMAMSRLPLLKSPVRANDPTGFRREETRPTLSRSTNKSDT